MKSQEDRKYDKGYHNEDKVHETSYNLVELFVARCCIKINKKQ